MSLTTKKSVKKERLKSAIDSGGSSVGKLIQKKPKLRYAIGIDVGIINGFSIWDRQLEKLEVVTSCKLFELFIEIQDWQNKTVEDIEVFIENPNTWKPFTKPNPSEQQGAGAVKQTYKHIVEFLEFKQIQFTPTKIQGNLKKLNRATFEKYTKWSKVTNEHARDSAMIVFGRK